MTEASGQAADDSEAGVGSESARDELLTAVLLAIADSIRLRLQLTRTALSCWMSDLHVSALTETVLSFAANRVSSYAQVAA